MDFYGTHIRYSYNNLVLSELDDEELLSGDNPFDLVLCAAKAAVKNKKKELQKYHYLRSLLGHLSKRGWSTQDKRDLMLFIERIINLKDETLAEKIVEYQRELEEEAKIVYVSLAEREGIKKGKLEGKREGKLEGKLEGKREGKLEGKLEAAKNFLAMGLPVDKVAKGTGLSEEEVRALLNS